MSIWEYANPKKFIETTDRVLPAITVLSVLCLGVGLVWGFFFTPDPAFKPTSTVAALRAGKHVLVDKPFATTLADARRVAAEAEGAGRLLTIFQNRRWDGDFLTVAPLLASPLVTILQ